MKVKVRLLTSNIFIGDNVKRYAKWVGKDGNGKLYLKKQLGFINGDDLTQEDFELLDKEQDKGLLKIVEIAD
jgi:hypothetical protein